MIRIKGAENSRNNQKTLSKESLDTLHLLKLPSNTIRIFINFQNSERPYKKHFKLPASQTRLNIIPQKSSNQTSNNLKQRADYVYRLMSSIFSDLVLLQCGARDQCFLSLMLLGLKHKIIVISEKVKVTFQKYFHSQLRADC